MPIPGNAPEVPPGPTVAQLLQQIDDLTVQLTDVRNRFGLFVGRIKAELIEKGAVTRAEIQADLDTLTD